MADRFDVVAVRVEEQLDIGERQEEHVGVMFSRLVDSKIQETFVVAREVSSAPEGEWEDRKIFN